MISKFKFNMVNIEGGNCAKKFHINKNKKKNENQTTAGRNIYLKQKGDCLSISMKSWEPCNFSSDFHFTFWLK